MPKLQLSNEEINNIVTDYHSGISITEIAKKYHHDRGTLLRYFKEHNIDIQLRTRSEAIKCSPRKQQADIDKRKYDVNDTYFSTQNSKMAYFLGFLMADGNVSKKNNRIQIQLSETDAEYLELYYKEIGGSPVVHYTINNDTQQICRWQCMSAQIKRDLITYGVIPNKTGFAKIPEQLDEKFYSDFIRGYFDGDGSIYIESSGAAGFEIVSHNSEILEQIVEYFAKNNIPKVNIHIDKRSNVNYYIKYRKTAIEQIFKLLYYDKNCFYLKRKFDKFQQILKK